MIEEAISKYIKLRDLKDARKKVYQAEVAQIDNAMHQLEGLLASELNTAKVDRMGCSEGVVFFQKSTSATVQDREQFFNYVQSTGQWSLADIRAAKTSIAEYLEETGEVPPGIKWAEAQVIRVNRPR